MDVDPFPRIELSLSALQGAHWKRFEYMVADLFHDMGYATYVRSPQKDAGIDVVASKRGLGGKTYAIQVKRYDGQDTNVSVDEVRKYYTMSAQIDADASLIVTTGWFKGSAPEVAEKLGVETMNGDEFLNAVESHATLAFYRKYADALGFDRERIDRELHARSNRSIPERVAVSGRNALGRALAQVGYIRIAAGRIARSCTNGVRNLHYRFTARKPIIAEEQEGSPNRLEQLEPLVAAADNSIERGSELIEVGKSWREPAAVTWAVPERELVPEQVIKPRLVRPIGNSRLREHAMLGIAALVCLAVIILAGWKGADISNNTVAVGLVAGSLIGLTGLLFRAVARSGSPLEALGVVYGIPTAIPLVVYLDDGFGVEPSNLAAVILAALLSFSVYLVTISVTIGDRDLVAVPELGTQFRKVNNPITVIGILGVSLVWYSLITSRIGSNELIPSLLTPSLMVAYGTSIGLIIVAGVSLRLAWEGGVFGVVSSFVAFASAIAVCIDQGLLGESVVSLPIIGGGLVLVAVSTGSYARSTHRAINTKSVLAWGLVLVVIYQSVASRGPTFPTVGSSALWSETVVLFTTIAATMLFVLLLWLESRSVYKPHGGRDSPGYGL